MSAKGTDSMTIAVSGKTLEVEIKQQKDNEEGQRHHCRKTRLGPFENTELTAPLDMVARRKHDLVADGFLSFLNIASKITALKVHINVADKLRVLLSVSKAHRG